MDQHDTRFHVRMQPLKCCRHWTFYSCLTLRWFMESIYLGEVTAEGFHPDEARLKFVHLIVSHELNKVGSRCITDCDAYFDKVAGKA
ncbi:hypothetical protein PanWU01x14_336760 [Parasponia andersonii]|uniref:Uncharacterized protein n=1 Tax=Parasponia andersonii TaxID=3476 RepID=A0A2P5AFU1_PARAD|nr:hypothetical protein PanWU01x14_336760 [Parasponia andersonii]